MQNQEVARVSLSLFSQHSPLLISFCVQTVDAGDTWWGRQEVPQMGLGSFREHSKHRPEPGARDIPAVMWEIKD